MLKFPAPSLLEPQCLLARVLVIFENWHLIIPRFRGKGEHKVVLTIKRTCLDPKDAPNGLGRFGHGRHPYTTTFFVGVMLVITRAFGDLISKQILVIFGVLIATSSAAGMLTLETEKAVYKLGERIVVRAHFAQNGFLYLFNVRADGLIDLLVPNRFADGDSRSWAGETRRFPETDSGWWFVAPEPVGKHQLIALLAPEGIKLDGLARFEPGNPFAVVKIHGLTNLENALKTRIPKSVTRVHFTYSVVKK